MNRFKRILAVLIIMVAAPMYSSARPKAISSLWSIYGIGIGYEYMTSDDVFIQIDLKTETSEMFLNRRFAMEAAASLTWNKIFAETSSAYGTQIRYFAGPGVTGGLARDMKADNGIVFGLKGRIGAELLFKRKVAISICLAPVIGMHISAKDGSANLRLYRTGLLYGVIPEIGLKYSF